VVEGESSRECAKAKIREGFGHIGRYWKMALVGAGRQHCVDGGRRCCVRERWGRTLRVVSDQSHVRPSPSDSRQLPSRPPLSMLPARVQTSPSGHLGTIIGAAPQVISTLTVSGYAGSLP
jgi:hypothetical protein